jgi:tetratricopeptide (TPR) repeat protein
MPVVERTKLSDLLGPAYRHLAAGEIEAARSLLEQGLQQYPETGLLRLLAARIVEMEGRTGEAASLFYEAAAALASAKDHGAAPADALRIERILAWNAKDWQWLRRAAGQLIAVEANPTAQDLMMLAAACHNLDDPDGVTTAAGRARAIDPRSIEAATLLAWAAAQGSDLETALSRYRDLAELAPDNPRWALETIRLMVFSGQVKEASDRLDTALTHWPNDPSLRAFALICGFRTPQQIEPPAEVPEPINIGALRERELRRVLAKPPKDAELLRPVIVDDKQSDVILAEALGAETAILVFTALNDVLSMPLPLFDRYLAAFGATAIYLKDFRRLSYLRGVASLGEDYVATLRALHSLRDRLPSKRWCTIGYSAGGSAAIRYGVEIGADRAVSFAGETHRARGPVARLERGSRLLSGRLQASVSEQEMDLREFLMTRRYAASIEIVYAQSADRDRAHAEHLSGAAGVKLRPVAGCDDHELLRWLALHEDLRAMLARLLALGFKSSMTLRRPLSDGCRPRCVAACGLDLLMTQLTSTRRSRGRCRSRPGSGSRAHTATSRSRGVAWRRRRRSTVGSRSCRN